MKNSIDVLLLRIKTQSTRKARASDAKHLLEGDLEIIEKLSTEALDNLTSSSRISNRSCCSKCGKSLSTRWEENACYIKLEIGIDCCSTEALFGRDEKIGFNHPAIKEGSGHQKVFIESRKESDYRLCWNCHRDFVKQVGTFLKNDC